MAIYACVVSRLPWEGSALVAVYVIAVVVIIAVWLTGHPLADTITAAVGAGYAASVPARRPRELA